MIGGEAKVTHHITTGGSYDFLKGYLVQIGYEPTLLVDPVHGNIAQFLPASRGAYALKHTTYQTNDQGSVNIQIEWMWDSMSNLTIDKSPKWAEVWGKVLAFARANGVPDHIPFGSINTQSSRDENLWVKGGHACHFNAPGNDHSDGLPVSTETGLFGATDRFLYLSNPEMTGNDVRNVQHALNVAGNHLAEDGVYGQSTANTVNLFNRRHNIRTANGYIARGVVPGTWAALRKIVHG